jgi:hypothetical protein
MTFKFGAMRDGAFVAHIYPNVFQHQQTGGGPRLGAALAEGHCDLLIALARELSGPFAILAIVHTSRIGQEGRHQSPPLKFADVERFVAEFRTFLEGDARLDLWIRSRADHGLLVYDRHNMIYAYGPLDSIEQILRARGLSPGEIETPEPHSHNYHAAHDGDEERLLRRFDWRKTPLRPEDRQVPPQ